MPDLCTDVFLKYGFLQHHESLEMPFSNSKPPFTNFTADCKPITIKSQRYADTEEKFEKEICRILKEGIIKPKNSKYYCPLQSITKIVTDYLLLTSMHNLMLNFFFE